MPTRLAVEKTIKELLARYNAEYALLFGSYARGDETPESDIDVVVFGGDHFKKLISLLLQKTLEKLLLQTQMYLKYLRYIKELLFTTPL